MLMVLYSLFNLFSQRHAKSFESNLENDTDDSILLDLTCYGVIKLLVLLSILCPVINLLLIQLCCLVQKELIRTVDLGPFKHIVDDGLELRKAAFECVDTLLDSCLDQVNPSSFIVPYLKSGLDGKHMSLLMTTHHFFN